MSQHDFNIANQSFPATRTDLNNALVALASNSSGDAEPATKYANQWWYETDTNTLKLRNEANDAWISIAVLDQSGNAVQSITTAGLTLGSTAISATGTEINQLDAITRGSIVYGNASGATARLAAGGASTVLTSDGTDISWAAAGGGGGTELLATSTASNSATLSFTGFDSSAYSSYLFKVDIKPVSAYVTLRARVSTDGGSNYLTSNTYYTDGATRNYMELSGGGGGTAAQNLRSGDVTLIGAGNTNNYTLLTSLVCKGGDDYLGFTYTKRNSLFSATTVVNAIQFYMSSGNFSSGTIHFYGFKK